MQHTILSTIHKSKGMTRECLSLNVRNKHPEADRFQVAYQINAALRKKYLNKYNPTKKKWDKNEVFSITSLGRARLKLLDMQQQQSA
jgi:hypothetical protein